MHIHVFTYPTFFIIPQATVDIFIIPQATVDIFTIPQATVDIFNYRVANVTGGLCKTAMVKCSEEIQSRFKNPNITIDELTALMNEFLE